MIADRLYERIAETGPVCLGLDTSPSYLPPGLAEKEGGEAEGVFAFNRAVIDATFDLVACFKVQIAYYEALGLRGMKAYADTLAYARSKGIQVIADVKRGDIAATADRYAKAHFTGDFEADWITVNPFMGMDTIETFMKQALAADKGIFVLARTSNPGAADFQYQTVEAPTGRRNPLYLTVASRIASIAALCIGDHGYSAVGAVTGCTHRDEARAIRQILRACFLLIPGYGAQGGTAEDVASYLTAGNGGVANASRSLLLAWREGEGGAAWFADRTRQKTLKMRQEIQLALIEAAR
jgi:orotidine-5'-phosphate decarboxylase